MEPIGLLSQRLVMLSQDSMQKSGGDDQLMILAAETLPDHDPPANMPRTTQ